METAAPLPKSACIGWGLGSVGTLTLIAVTNGLVLKYAVDIVGISAAVAGLIIAFTRIFDAAIDPFMGSLSDRTVSKWGRRRPFLLVGAFLCALAPVLIFAAPASLSGTSAIAYMVMALLFYAVAYTSFNVPYMAMPVEMTQSHHERTFLFSFRVYGSAIGGLLGGAFAPWIITELGGGKPGFAGMGYVIGITVFFACLASFWLTRNAPISPVQARDPRSKFTQFKLAFGNKPFISLLIAKIFIVAGTGIGAASMAFFVTSVLRQPLSWLGLFAASATAAMILSQPLWLKIAKAQGKRKAYLIAGSLYVVVVLTWLFAGPGEPQYAIIARAGILGFIGGGILLNSQAMLPDTLEHEFVLTGVRHEGVLTGLYTTVERGASALGVAVAGFILGAGGYVAGAEAAIQTQAAIQSIYISMAIMPAAAIALSMVFIWRYNLPG